MRIQSSELAFAARHQLSVSDRESSSLQVTVGGTTQEVKSARSREGAALDEVGISATARQVLAAAERSQARDDVRDALRTESATGPAKVDEAENEHETPQLKLFRLAVEALTGKRIRATDKIDEEGAEEETAKVAAKHGDGSRVTRNDDRAQWAISYDYAREYHESEQTSVAAMGVVNTADGKQIEFAMQVTMQREYHEVESHSVRLGNAKLRDPLVLQFDGPAAELQEGTFAFDIDSDGAPDDIHFMAPGGAALALDKNDNGRVDDGSELFGTRTGDGFAELANHDADKNGWIDEADPIFDELKLWSRSEDGKDRLGTLSERGVGAIYLGKVSSPFQIKDASNQLQGVVRATGVWLSEDGRARPAQQIDLVV
jgi:hypothetical protein